MNTFNNEKVAAAIARAAFHAKSVCRRLVNQVAERPERVGQFLVSLRRWLPSDSRNHIWLDKKHWWDIGVPSVSAPSFMHIFCQRALTINDDSIQMILLDMDELSDECDQLGACSVRYAQAVVDGESRLGIDTE